MSVCPTCPQHVSSFPEDAPRNEYLVATEATNQNFMRRRALIEGVRPFSSTPSFDADAFEEDVAWELGQLRQAGHDRVVLIDLTLPDIGLAVVRAVIPGMEFESGAAGRRRPAGDVT